MSDVLEAGMAIGQDAEARAFKKRRLLVASGKGGSAKTTTCRHLCVAAAQAGLSVLGVDLDESPTLSTWWSRRPDHLPSIDLIHAPIEQLGNAAKTKDDLSDLSEEMGTRLMVEIEREIKALDGYDLMIIDTPASLAAYPYHARALVKLAHFVLVPTAQYSDDIQSVTKWMTLIQDLSGQGMFLLTDTHRRESAFEEAKRRLVEFGPLCPIDVPHFADIPKTLDLGLTVLDVMRGQKKARGAEDYTAVFADVRRKLGL
jgi:chromosome partitioning protein